MLKSLSRVRGVGAFLLALMSIVSSAGCMIEPGHGQSYPTRDSVIGFTGLVRERGLPVEVQAFHRRRGWETITRATADVYYHDHNGTWYIWDTERVVPDEYWSWNGFRSEVRLRARNAVDGQPLHAFDKSFPWMQFLYPTGPEFLTMSEVEMWFTWGHGKEVIVYANDFLCLLESDRGF